MFAYMMVLSRKGSHECFRDSSSSKQSSYAHLSCVPASWVTCLLAHQGAQKREFSTSAPQMLLEIRALLPVFLRVLSGVLFLLCLTVYILDVLHVSCSEASHLRQTIKVSGLDLYSLTC